MMLLGQWLVVKIEKIFQLLYSNLTSFQSLCLMFQSDDILIEISFPWITFMPTKLSWLSVELRSPLIHSDTRIGSIKHSSNGILLGVWAVLKRLSPTNRVKEPNRQTSVTSSLEPVARCVLVVLRYPRCFVYDSATRPALA